MSGMPIYLMHSNLSNQYLFPVCYLLYFSVNHVDISSVLVDIVENAVVSDSDSISSE